MRWNILQVLVWMIISIILIAHQDAESKIQKPIASVRQSSAAYDSTPQKVLEGGKKTIFGNNKCDISTTSTQIGELWQYITTFKFEFDDLYMITEMEFEILDLKHPIENRVVSAYTGMDTQSQKNNELCDQWTDPSHEHSVLNLKCKTPAKGFVSTVIINVTMTSPPPSKSITNLGGCATKKTTKSYKMKGYKITNFAFHKPTKGSLETCSEEQYCSERLVDGSNLIISDSELSPTNPACQLRGGPVAYPWWRVDLLKYHIVKAVTVGGIKTDIVIRVGNDDISKSSAAIEFVGNTLCKNIASEYNATTSRKISNFVECDTPILGRYVSIQRVAKHPYDFKLCEVQVHGFLASITDYGMTDLIRRRHTTADGKVNYSFMNTDRSLFQTWTQKFNEEVAVDAIDIYFHDSFSNFSNKMNLSVIIGSTKYFDDVIEITEAFISIPCNFSLEKEIYVEYQWFPLTTDTESPVVFVVANVIKFSVDNSNTKLPLQPYKPGPDDDHKGVVKDSKISVDSYSDPTDIFDRYENICSYTVAGDPFPWWRVDFNGTFKVTSFEIHTEKNGDYDELHDIEVRVGFSDIANSTSSTPFKLNKLCYATGSNRLLETAKKIDCDPEVVGRYFSIQIVKSCSNSKVCNMIAPNVLKLCYIKFDKQFIKSLEKV